MSEISYIERYWRDAKPEDAIAEPPMVARFRDDPRRSWRFDCNQRLTGVDRDDGGIAIRWFSNKTSISFGHCQVYDAPDPGEGWRLIDTENEKPQDGDEYYSDLGTWLPRPLKKAAFTVLDIYRRRITPIVTYVPFTWEDRDQLRGRWITRDNQELQLVNLDNSDGFHANDVHVDNLCKYWKFLDTGKPVGKEVMQ